MYARDMPRAPIYVRNLSDEERRALTVGLCARDAFVLRRCQIVLASAQGKRASQIAAELGCDELVLVFGAKWCLAFAWAAPRFVIKLQRIGVGARDTMPIPGDGTWDCRRSLPKWRRVLSL